MLARLEQGSTAARVGHVPQRPMRGSELTLAAVAAELSMRPRTLQRRLADEDAYFTQLLDDVRRDSAERYLGTCTIGLAELAFLLGFAKPNSFFRVFKRWAGVSPEVWRVNNPLRL